MWDEDGRAQTEKRIGSFVGNFESFLLNLYTSTYLLSIIIILRFCVCVCDISMTVSLYLPCYTKKAGHVLRDRNIIYEVCSPNTILDNIQT